MISPGDSPSRTRLEARMLAFAREVGAGGITLWKAEGNELVAVANPLEPAMIGQRQPADRGLISMAFLTGQPILERQLKSHPHHDPSIDRHLGTRGVALMAAPVPDPTSDDNAGVLSAVLLEGHRAEVDFSLASLGRLSELASQLATDLP